VSAADPTANEGQAPVAPRTFLARHAPFDRLPAGVLDALEDALEIRFAAAGDVLLRRGGPPSDALWVVRKGHVQLERDGTPLEDIGPGECFGYPSLLGGRSPMRDAIATQDSLLLRIPAAAFRRLLDEPGAARFFLDGLADRLRGLAPRTGGLDRQLVVPLREAASRDLATIAPDATASDAARLMRERAVGSLLVVDAPAGDAGLLRAALRGILTDRDLRNRLLAAGRGPETPVAEVMTHPVAVVDAGATSLDAMLAMSAGGFRHLPVVERDRIVGLVSAGDLVRLQTQHPLALLRRVQRQPLPELLPSYATELRRTVRELAGAGLEAAHIGPLVATVNDALARRLVAAAELQLGPAPVRWAWMVHGSDGRREQLLPTDQDNALVWALPPADDGQALASEATPPETAAQWAAGLAEHMVQGLTAAGFPLCPGGYMATQWHDSLAQWVERLDHWTNHPRPELLLDLSTLLDLRLVTGNLDLAPLEELRVAAGRNRLLLRMMAEDCSRWPLPLGVFGGLREREQSFDLKRGSLLIVAVARLFALEAGHPATSTLDRLRVAEDVLGPDAATLAESFRFLASLRLEHALGEGEGRSHRLRLADLNTMERRFLKDIFGFLRQLLESLPQRFAL
jgi:CBS domain-containing protein